MQHICAQHFMMKRIHTILLILIALSCFGQTKEELQSAINDLSKKIIYKNPYGFDNSIYADLAYLKRSFNLPYLSINDTIFKKRLNDYYYKRFYPYSKLLDDRAIVTEDCLNDEANEKINRGIKVLFYVLYPNSIKLPDNIVDQLEEYSTEEEFFSQYFMLQDIYFLKKYNLSNLTTTQKDQLRSLEYSLSDKLYTKYVVGKPWGFYKFLSLKVLKMNEFNAAAAVDISDLVKYFNSNGPVELGQEDSKDISLLSRIGASKIIQYESTALLWIFLTELDKK